MVLAALPGLLLAVASTRSWAVRTLVRDACVLKEQAIRIEYQEPGTQNEGEFDFVKISSWDGLRLLTKTYGDCSVDYSITCSGSDLSLVVEDSCGSRTTTRSLESYRSTVLHHSQFSVYHGWRDADKQIQLHLPIGKKLVMHADGSTVVFRRIEPLPLEEQLKNPSSFRFFAAVPRMASCLPEPAEETFPSPVLQRTYSAQKCSACNNLLESTVQDVEQCSTTETMGARLRCKKFSAEMHKEDADVLAAMKKSLDKVKDDMALPLTVNMGCQDLGCCPLDPDTADVLAKEANISLVREMAHEQSDEKSMQVDREKRAANLKKVEEEGLVAQVLNDPDVRRKLEALTSMKAQRATKLKKESSSARAAKLRKVPTKDVDCFWQYSTSRCEPHDHCEYKYRFGDYKLAQSCRMKVRFLPTSDKDCKWNYKEVRCNFPDYCKRQCAFGDLNLDQCCKLHKKSVQSLKDTNVSESSVDDSSEPDAPPSIQPGKDDGDIEDDDIGLVASPEDDSDKWIDDILKDIKDDDIGLEADSEWLGLKDQGGDDIGLEASQPGDGSAEGEDDVEGNCQSEADRKILQKPGLQDEMEAIGRETFSVWKLALNREKNLKLHIERTGLSEVCATCFVDVADCGVTRCFKQSVSGAKSEAFLNCLEEKKCKQDLYDCTGLSSEELP
mmetsp:Transcript_2526/g.6037  ORF Transcript_2526/g.6037 Transcript_2526/m.6037 type:complete len:670 (+) Transcript_2526:44-2053(+)